MPCTYLTLSNPPMAPLLISILLPAGYTLWLYLFDLALNNQRILKKLLHPFDCWTEQVATSRLLLTPTFKILCFKKFSMKVQICLKINLSSQSKSKLTAVSLVQDVKTCWNSTLKMFLCFLSLWDVVEKFCEPPDCKQYAMSQVEWDQIHQMWNFLKPLFDATNEMFKLRFPTMHSMIPTYISVMKGLKWVSFSLKYDSVSSICFCFSFQYNR